MTSWVLIIFLSAVKSIRSFVSLFYCTASPDSSTLSPCYLLLLLLAQYVFSNHDSILHWRILVEWRMHERWTGGLLLKTTERCSQKLFLFSKQLLPNKYNVASNVYLPLSWFDPSNSCFCPRTLDLLFNTKSSLFELMNNHLRIGSIGCLLLVTFTTLSDIYSNILFLFKGNVFCANRFRVPAVTLFFDILSFPFMVRREKNIVAGIVESLPVNTTALRVEYDLRNVQKIETAILSQTKPAAFNPKIISKSYVNIKKYCVPWPKCVLTHWLTQGVVWRAAPEIFRSCIVLGRKAIMREDDEISPKILLIF